jgi:hypothetical protein
VLDLKSLWMGLMGPNDPPLSFREWEGGCVICIGWKSMLEF